MDKTKKQTPANAEAWAKCRLKGIAINVIRLSANADNVPHSVRIHLNSAYNALARALDAWEDE